MAHGTQIACFVLEVVKSGSLIHSIRLGVFVSNKKPRTNFSFGASCWSLQFYDILGLRSAIALDDIGFSAFRFGAWSLPAVIWRVLLRSHRRKI